MLALGLEHSALILTVSTPAEFSWHTDWDWSGGNNSVKAYPYSGRQLATKRLVNAISSISNSAEWQYQGQNLRCNVAYDLFTAADPNHSTNSGDYEVMIWQVLVDISRGSRAKSLPFAQACTAWRRKANRHLPRECQCWR